LENNCFKYGILNDKNFDIVKFIKNNKKVTHINNREKADDEIDDEDVYIHNSWCEDEYLYDGFPMIYLYDGFPMRCVCYFCCDDKNGYVICSKTNDIKSIIELTNYYEQNFKSNDNTQLTWKYAQCRC
jgi:hypothetical protein